MSKNQLLQKYQAERQPVQRWCRVMGYIRNKESFNTGKQQEAADRVCFKAVA